MKIDYHSRLHLKDVGLQENYKGIIAKNYFIFKCKNITGEVVQNAAFVLEKAE
ncbi:MAG: Unknown protein [uncultured Sulfurovum sp.]|uniref:Uncharacterized protein n=1 Tax=uncultured Sulfurovum sp. TaxID=269237 RepID=A0A6S6THP3_9BACT|nr:MAG: Unknown protein [uncultured Sulfurovum sp.]